MDSYLINNPNYTNEKIISHDALLCFIICIIVFWIHLFIIFKINIIQALFTRFNQRYYHLSIIKNILSPIQQQNNSDIQPIIPTETCCICLSSITWEVASTCGHIFCGMLDNFLKHIIVIRGMHYLFMGSKE